MSMKNIVSSVVDAISEVGELTKKEKNQIKLTDPISKFQFDVVDKAEVIAMVEHKLQKTANLIGVERMVTVNDMVNLFKLKKEEIISENESI